MKKALMMMALVAGMMMVMMLMMCGLARADADWNHVHNDISLAQQHGEDLVSMISVFPNQNSKMRYLRTTAQLGLQRVMSCHDLIDDYLGNMPGGGFGGGTGGPGGGFGNGPGSFDGDFGGGGGGFGGGHDGGFGGGTGGFGGSTGGFDNGFGGTGGGFHSNFNVPHSVHESMFQRARQAKRIYDTLEFVCGTFERGSSGGQRNYFRQLRLTCDAASDCLRHVMEELN